MTSTPTKPVDNVVIATKGLQDRTTNVTAGTTVENKGKLILLYKDLKFHYWAITIPYKVNIIIIVVEIEFSIMFYSAAIINI